MNIQINEEERPLNNDRLITAIQNLNIKRNNEAQTFITLRRDTIEGLIERRNTSTLAGIAIKGFEKSKKNNGSNAQKTFVKLMETMQDNQSEEEIANCCFCCCIPLLKCFGLN